MSELILKAIALYVHGVAIMILMMNYRIYHRYGRWTWYNFTKSIKYSMLSYLGISLIGMGMFDPFSDRTAPDERIAIK